MGSILVRQIDDRTKKRLKSRAARHGRSMEEEVREILKAAVSAEEVPQGNLAEEIHALFAPLGGVTLPEIPREPGREPPNFE